MLLIVTPMILFFGMMTTFNISPILSWVVVVWVDNTLIGYGNDILFDVTQFEGHAKLKHSYLKLPFVNVVSSCTRMS